MKLRQAICRRRGSDLRRERNARAFDDAEKIGARLKMRATRDPKQQHGQWEKMLHAIFVPN